MVNIFNHKQAANESDGQKGNVGWRVTRGLQLWDAEATFTLDYVATVSRDPGVVCFHYHLVFLLEGGGGRPRKQHC